MRFLTIGLSLLLTSVLYAGDDVINIFAPVDKRSSETIEQKPAPTISVSAFEIRGAIRVGKYNGLMIRVKDKKYLAETGGKENITLKKGEKIGEYTFNKVEGYEALFNSKDNETIKVPLLSISSSKTATEAVKAEKVLRIDVPANQNNSLVTTTASGVSSTSAPEGDKNVPKTGTPVKKDYMPRANDNSTKNVPKSEPSEGVKKFIDIIKQRQQQKGGTTTPGQNPFLNMFNN